MVNTDKNIIWHASQWEQITQMLSQDRFPHALLLEGMRGVGKKVFAFQLAQKLLCKGKSESQGDSGICQVCPSCEWFLASTHPDFALLEPEEGKKLISIDAVRNASSQVFKTSHQDGYRVLIIEPADALTLAAANSLLKTLEEPPAKTLLMLLTDKPNKLLPTIRSRARRLQFKNPDSEQALSWLKTEGLNQSQADSVLKLSLGAPLRFDLDDIDIDDLISKSSGWQQDWQVLLAKSGDPVQIGKEWAKQDPDLFLSWLDDTVQGVIVSAMSEKGSSGKSMLSSLFQLRDALVELSHKKQGSLNWPLQMETLAIQCKLL